MSGAQRLKSETATGNGGIGLVSMNGRDGKLRPDGGENTTTVTHGQDHSRSNSSERILMKDDPEMGMGILRTFEVTTTTSEERQPTSHQHYPAERF